jgi:peptidoglycan L-alanyl-D-glutamate endopeptidase CwlK
MINSRKIEDLHPKLQELCRKHIAACKAKGVDIIVTNTLRDTEYQASLYAQGRTKPGSIVTNMQQIGPHGFGLAYDIVPVVYGKAVWNNPRLWVVIGEEGKKLGLTWGGDWKSIVDKPHFEYTGGLKSAELRAGKRPAWWVLKKEEPRISKVLKRGIAAEEVKVLQTMLNKFDYKLTIDGQFGFVTEAAVKGFQAKKGLDADGIVGPKTWAKLYER